MSATFRICIVNLHWLLPFCRQARAYSQLHRHQSNKQSHANRFLFYNAVSLSACTCLKYSKYLLPLTSTVMQIDQEWRILMALYVMLLERKWCENKSWSYFSWHEKRGYNHLKWLLQHRGVEHFTMSYLIFYLYVKNEILYVCNRVWLWKNNQRQARHYSHLAINQISIGMRSYQEQKTFVDISEDDIRKTMTCQQVMIILPLTWKGGYDHLKCLLYDHIKCLLHRGIEHFIVSYLIFFLEAKNELLYIQACLTF